MSQHILTRPARAGHLEKILERAQHHLMMDRLTLALAATASILVALRLLP